MGSDLGAEPPPRGNQRAAVHVPLKPIRHAGRALACRIPDASRTFHPHLSATDRAETAWARRMLTDGDFFESYIDSAALAGSPSRPCSLSPEDDAMLLTSGVAVPCPRGTRGRVTAAAYKVLKSDGVSARLILPCVALNRATVRPATFRIAAPREVARWLRSAGVAASSDGVNWFYQFALPPSVRRFFAYRLGPSPRLMAVLTMGHTQSPRVAHTLMCALAGASPTSVATDIGRHPAMVIIDNVLLAARGKRALRRRLAAFDGACAAANALIQADTPPSTDGVVHGGVEYRLSPLRWRLKRGWAARFAANAAAGTVGPCTWAWWRSALGSAVWACRVLEIPLAHLTSLWRRLKPFALADDGSATVALDERAQRAWTALTALVGTDPWVRATTRRPFRVWLWADASTYGAGWTWYHPLRGWASGSIKWTDVEAAAAAGRMPWAEARATRVALRALYRSDLPRRRACVNIVTDCLPWYHALRSGAPRSGWLAAEYLRIAAEADVRSLQYRPCWCDTRRMLADAPSRGLPLVLRHPIPYPSRMSSDYLPFATPCDPPQHDGRLLTAAL